MNQKEFGKNLQHYREKAGLSQEQLAEQVERSTIFISYLERGIRHPGLETLILLANALDVSIDNLLGQEVKSYNFSKLKEIEKQIENFSEKERKKFFEIMDNIIMIEVKYFN